MIENKNSFCRSKNVQQSSTDLVIVALYFEYKRHNGFLDTKCQN